MLTEEPLHFLIPLADVAVREKQTAIFKCQVSKPNQPAVWKKGATELTPGGRYEFGVQDTLYDLVIRDAEVADEAQYSVVIADQQSQATLFVEGKDLFSS